MLNHGRDVDGGSELKRGAVDFSNNSLNTLDSGNSFANQLLGNFNSYTHANTPTYTGARRRLFDWYAQDTWKATKNLTLICGVRFTVSTWFYPAGPGATFYALDYNRYAPTETTLPSPYISAIVPGSGNTDNGMVLNLINAATGFNSTAGAQTIAVLTQYQ